MRKAKKVEAVVEVQELPKPITEEPTEGLKPLKELEEPEEVFDPRLMERIVLRDALHGRREWIRTIISAEKRLNTGAKETKKLLAEYGAQLQACERLMKRMDKGTA
jgi:hypothetical protein